MSLPERFLIETRNRAIFRLVEEHARKIGFTINRYDYYQYFRTRTMGVTPGRSSSTRNKYLSVGSSDGSWVEIKLNDFLNIVAR